MSHLFTSTNCIVQKASIFLEIYFNSVGIEQRTNRRLNMSQSFRISGDFLSLLRLEFRGIFCHPVFRIQRDFLSFRLLGFFVNSVIPSFIFSGDFPSSLALGSWGIFHNSVFQELDLFRHSIHSIQLLGSPPSNAILKIHVP